MHLLVVQSWLLSLALASTVEPIMKWFKACREKDAKTIGEFGSEFLYELHQNHHFEGKASMADRTFSAHNCYHMILFDYKFRAKDHGGILRRFVELGMPVKDYHFQVTTSEEELTFLIDAAEQRGQALDYSSLLCHASAGGYLGLFERLRTRATSAQEVGLVERLSWRLGPYGFPRHMYSRKEPSTPLLSAVKGNKIEMVEYLLVEEGVEVDLPDLPSPLVLCFNQYSFQPVYVKVIIGLLVLAGCSLKPWEELHENKNYWTYMGALKNGHDVVINAAVKRRKILISKLERGVPLETLSNEGYSPLAIKCCIRALGK